MPYPRTSNRLDKSFTRHVQTDHGQDLINDQCSIQGQHPTQGRRLQYDQRTPQAPCIPDSGIDSFDTTTDVLFRLTTVLDEKSIPYQWVKETPLQPSPTVVQILLNHKSYRFTHHRIFNDDFTEAHLLNDPEYRYQLFNQQIQMPKTMGFMCPMQELPLTPDDNYLHSLSEVVQRCLAYPVLIKIHSTKTCKHTKTFFCEDRRAIARSLHWIAQHRLKQVNLIIEAYIPSAKQYQVFCYGQTILLAYECQASSPTRKGQSRKMGSVQLKESFKLKQCQRLAKPLFEQLGSVFSNVEFIEDKQGELYLTSFTTNPSIKDWLSDSADKNDPLTGSLSVYRRIFDRLLTTAEPT